jgi:exodeoxyribonuclease VII small subunit
MNMPSSKASKHRALGAHSQPADSPPSRETGVDGIDDLTFQEARSALDLTLAELQGSQLDVEAMVDLYRRALRYVERCETVLEQVEQEVMQWDPSDPGALPKPFEP